MRVERRQQRESLEGFAEAHFVGEDAAKVVAVEVPEPGDANFLIRTEQCIERGWDGRRLKRGEIAEGVAAGFPGVGRLKVRGDFFEDALGLDEAGGADAVGAAGGAADAAFAGEGALGLGEFLELLGGDQVDLTVFLDVAAAAGGGGENLVFGYATGAEGEGDVVAVAVVHGVAGDLGVAEAGGVFFEIVGELGEEFVAQALAVGGEEVEDLVAVAEPPFARRRFEDETGGFDEIEGGGVAEAFARGQADGEEVFGAVDCQWGGCFGGAGSGKRCACGGGRSGADGAGARDRDRGAGAGLGRGFDEMFADAAEALAEPEEIGLWRVNERENGLAGGCGDEFAKLGAGELEKRGRLLGAAETLENREDGEEGGLRRGAQVELDLQRDGVARSGGGEIGRQEQTEHRNNVCRRGGVASFFPKKERRE